MYRQQTIDIIKMLNHFLFCYEYVVVDHIETFAQIQQNYKCNVCNVLS